VRREVRKLAVGFSALRRQAPPPSSSPLVAASLWGSEGFGGGQPVARMLLLAAAASEAGVRLRLLLPRGCEAKWFKGVVAELRAADARGAPHNSASLVRLLCAEAPQSKPRLATDVAAFASYVIRTLRSGAPFQTSAPVSAPSAVSAAAAPAEARAAPPSAGARPREEGRGAAPIKRPRWQRS